MSPKKIFSILVAAAAILCANSANACAMCYGKSDSPLAAAMNWGIFSLMGVVVCVLGTIASFFIYLARRAAAAPPPPMPKDSLPLPETNKA
jgi:hypothetical protein